VSWDLKRFYCNSKLEARQDARNGVQRRFVGEPARPDEE
jgi:hypothetical protein